MGGQSSFDHVHVQSTYWIFKKILGKILVYHTEGGQSPFDHVHVQSLKKFKIPMTDQDLT